MKKFSLLMCSAVILWGCNNQQQVNSVAVKQKSSAADPEQLYCTGSQQWMAFEKPVNSELDIDGVSFEKDGSFRMAFTEKNKGITNGHTCTVEGTTTLSRNAKGQNIIALHPEKGTRKNNEGDSTRLAINKTELESKFAATYRWEKVCFPQMPSEDFLVLARMDNPDDTNKRLVTKLHLHQ